MRDKRMALSLMGQTHLRMPLLVNKWSLQQPGDGQRRHWGDNFGFPMGVLNFHISVSVLLFIEGDATFQGVRSLRLFL